MQNLKFEASLDLANTDQVEAFKTFVTAVNLSLQEGSHGGQAKVNSIEVVEPQEVSAKTPAPRKSRAEAIEEATEEAIEEATEEATEEAIEEAPKTIKLETIRAELSKKVQDHREAIKDKLDFFGTPNAANLDAKHYGDFMDFLKAL